MNRLHSVVASGVSTEAVMAALADQLPPGAAEVRMVFAFYGCGHDDQALHRFLRARFPSAALMGGSSSGGLITERGFSGQDSIGLLLVDDPEGEYGVAGAALGPDPAQSAEALLRQALAHCGCSGELPELIWIYQAPGHEEAVIAGLRRIVGDRCPIIGGSSADNDVSGRWRQLGPEGTMADGLVVGVLFPSGSIGYAFQGGYEPAGPNGIVTGIGYQPAGASGIVTGRIGREILTIDGDPAAQVYNHWIGHRLDSRLQSGGTILAETTMFPLAADAGKADGVTHYLLIHPESISSDGALRTFCDLEVGSRVYAMKGDRQRLVDRAGRVAEQARLALPGGHRGVAGGLIVYCGGCKLAVGDDITQVASAVAQGLGQAAFVGCFTFGEQGRLIDRNVHGNLMISAIAFGR
jgi:hypothetical protein